MKKTSSALLLTALLLAPLAAKADVTPGWYVGAGTGVNFAEKSTGHTPSGVNGITYDPGVSLNANGGYSWSNGLRAEGEVFYDRPNVNSIRGLPGGSGHLSNLDFFGNGYYDFNTGSIFTPYVGGGAGLALVTAKGIGALRNGGFVNESDKMAFAYQGIAGVAAQLDKHWALTVDYRYVATMEPRLHVTTGGSSRTTDDQHNIMVGLRYNFGEPAAPVADASPEPRPMSRMAAKPAVAQAAASFVVFFDFNKSALTPEAKRIIASAAAEYKKGGYVKLVVNGNTDTVGSNKYNKTLSLHRAAAVKAELVRLGLDSKGIVTHANGKSDPMVATGDNVRDAHNRRAEIDLVK